jgi:AcrR family transcriptional regulator
MASRARERILAAAIRRFSEDGILATSVDRVIADADVAPMTLYRQFGGKDELVTATLERWSDRWLGWLGEAVDGGRPEARFAGLWDAIEKWFASEDYRGSYVASAATELRGRPGHPAHRAIAAHRRRTRELLADVVRAAGAGDPERLALQLQLLLDGAVTVAVVDRQPGVAAAARAVATALLAEHQGAGR